MLPSINEPAVFEDNNLNHNNTLQLLLFVDDRLSSQKNIEQIKAYLDNLTKDYQFQLVQLEVIEIGKHPDLVEHFKLVATPALVKINPPPRQTLAGSNLTAQLQKWWSRWQNALQTRQHNGQQEVGSQASILQTCLPSSELIRMSDEIFRLKQEIEELKKQLQFKDQILAMLAHELRSPLTVASIALETIELAKNEQNSQSTAELQDQLYQQAKKQFVIMNKMITDLLETSKTMSSQLSISPEQLPLSALSEEILTNLQTKFKDKNQQLIQDIPQDLPLVYADGELIRQVIVNLLENAIKYTPARGQITLSIIHRTTQKVQVSVYDTGPGIPEEKRERIFDGHFRLKRDEATEGYGLGLALCRKIVNAHYGQIWVENNQHQGQGSCFHFTLPVYR
jgi:two-component system clock-associated histidine kinase SasA